MNNVRVPKISVIMSVLNGELYMNRGIESIINQTFTDWEFIICDDGSTDNTWKILQEYAVKDSRIIPIKNDCNQGLAYSLNRCIEIAKSEILARQDADDESAVNRFEIQYPFVIGHPEYAIVGTAWYNVDEENNKWLTTPIEKPRVKDLIWDGGFMHPSWMMRKELLKKVGFYTTGSLTLRDQDYHLVMKIYGAGMKMYNLSTPLYYYANNTETFSRTKNWKRVKGLMWIRWDGYRRNHLPFWVYIVVFKPLIKNLLPTCITKRYYMRNRYNENINSN